ncbi:hypothetical protein MIMGU_mgv1a016733mg [Erythranthe guttata]|uniref:Uncharacterized protein n=1 Tax=Erythranthe guttata TaxID=4155 RepID=A0A022QFC4_ERYGU|nr:hypothetical protein MIMGU_mgv1a016733mg [Erythranthe guttata]
MHVFVDPCIISRITSYKVTNTSKLLKNASDPVSFLGKRQSYSRSLESNWISSLLCLHEYQYMSSCYKCCPLDLRILLQDPGAICLPLAFLEFFPRDVLLPTGKKNIVRK